MQAIYCFLTGDFVIPAQAGIQPLISLNVMKLGIIKKTLRINQSEFKRL
jgi:hypothetical protein